MTINRGKELPIQARSFWLLLLIEMRPKQWTKNFVIFAALLFSYKSTPLSLVYMTMVGFVLFCIVSSCVYIVNDYVDQEADQNHPEKKHRPMASGELMPNFALSVGAILLVSSIAISFAINVVFGIIILGYFAINVAYTLWLKHVVIIDVMVIAIGFVLRAIGGGLIIKVSFTPWFLLCIMLLSLFLGLSKRKNEYLLQQNGAGVSRRVLDKYSDELLNQLNSIVTTATIICYSLFTFTSGHSIYLMGTIPLVIYGIFRYLYLIHVKELGGKPEKILLEDRHIQATVILYAISVIAVLYYFG